MNNVGEKTKNTLLHKSVFSFMIICPPWASNCFQIKPSEDVGGLNYFSSLLVIVSHSILVFISISYRTPVAAGTAV